MSKQQADELNNWLQAKKPVRVHSESEDDIRKPISVEDAFVLKQKGIRQHTEAKLDSMRSFASKRDAALFASSLKSKDELLKDYKEWLEFFTSLYDSNGDVDQPF